MAWYQNCKQSDEARTTAYRFTVKTKDDPMLLELKENVKRHNKAAREYQREYYKNTGNVCNGNYSQIERVLLMGRGPRGKDGKLFHPNAESNLQHEYATHFDVYVGLDCHNQYLLNQQLQSDLTPGQWNMIQKLEMKELELKWANDAKLRKAGMHRIFEDRGRSRWVGPAAYEKHTGEYARKTAELLEKHHNETPEQRRARLQNWQDSLDTKDNPDRNY